MGAAKTHITVMDMMLAVPAQHWNPVSARFVTPQSASAASTHPANTATTTTARRAKRSGARDKRF
jgi:hypothetical protein